jgi:hypothetical protein
LAYRETYSAKEGERAIKKNPDDFARDSTGSLLSCYLWDKNDGSVPETRGTTIGSVDD